MRKKEKRARDEHLNRYVGQAAENTERIVRASQIIEHPNTSQGVRVVCVS